jgi:cell division protease FtsH
MAGGDERLRTHSERTACEIDEEVRRIIEEAMEKVRHILETRRSALEAITRRLIEVESIDSDELQRILAEADPVPRIVPGTAEAVANRPAAEPRDARPAEQSG